MGRKNSKAGIVPQPVKWYDADDRKRFVLEHILENLPVYIDGKRNLC